LEEFKKRNEGRKDLRKIDKMVILETGYTITLYTPTAYGR